ncbi:GCN5-related N-acetyltransferase domain protein [mine drainage metagenome]|uniref:GCN5-related N-acetyltransferase domain protein n=1 Tax=mine drainage metagenome TaxID=410659 RepID=T1A7V8_9ZZZZ
MTTRDTIYIRRIRSGDWDALRILRLAALQTDPLAFGSNLRREQESDPQKWKNWATRGSTGTREAIYVAENEAGQLVGMIGSFTEDEQPHVWGLWVHPKSRRKRIGGRLLDQLLGWLASAAPARPVLLEVNPSQEAASSLYAGRGFVRTGRTRPLGHSPPAIVEEMAREPPVTGQSREP